MGVLLVIVRFMIFQLRSIDTELQLAITERDTPVCSYTTTFKLAPCRIIARATASLPLSIAAQSIVLPHVSRFSEIWSFGAFWSSSLTVSSRPDLVAMDIAWKLSFEKFSFGLKIYFWLIDLKKLSDLTHTKRPSTQCSTCITDISVQFLSRSLIM